MGAVANAFSSRQPPPDPRGEALDALREEARGVARTREPGRGDALNRAAFMCGRFVAADAIEAGTVEVDLVAAAGDCGLLKKDGHGNVVRTIRKGLEAGVRNANNWTGYTRPRLATQVRQTPEEDRRAAEWRREAIEKAAFAEFTYLSADRIAGSLAESYLARRGLVAGRDLRFARAAPLGYRADRTAPAMVAAVRDLAGAILGAQVTPLNADGSKRGRFTLGAVAGGAVQLAPVAADGQLAIAEGVETGLAFSALYGVPCWAALGTSGLKAFKPPAGLATLIVAADPDEPGMEAAQHLAQRASAACRVVISAATGGDWADVLMRERPA